MPMSSRGFPRGSGCTSLPHEPAAGAGRPPYQQDIVLLHPHPSVPDAVGCSALRTTPSVPDPVPASCAGMRILMRFTV